MTIQISPFLQQLTRLCRERPRRLALPESDDVRVLRAAADLLEAKAAQSVWLFGAAPELLAKAEAVGINLHSHVESIRWVHPSDPVFRSATRDHLAAFAGKRGKVLSAAVLDEASSSRLDQAAYLLASEQVDAVIAGCVHTTAEVIRAALRGVGLAPGNRTISSSFAMIREGGSLPAHRYIYADCGVVIDPSPEQLVDIAAASVATFSALFPDETPVLAFLSFSTRGSAQHPSVDKMQEALRLFRERYPWIAADGEFQFDAAYDAAIGERKAPGSQVPGRANCFLFPDLNAGNIAYKISQRLGFFDAYGPILQGTTRPYTDLSRGASARDIVASALIASLRATDAELPKPKA